MVCSSSYRHILKRSILHPGHLVVKNKDFQHIERKYNTCIVYVLNILKLIVADII